MKVRYANATNCPPGQFVITAENENEQEILRKFYRANHTGEWRLWLHGVTYSLDTAPESGPSSINFGYIKAPTLGELVNMVAKKFWKNLKIRCSS